jgi:hypothetical protein
VPLSGFHDALLVALIVLLLGAGGYFLARGRNARPRDAAPAAGKPPGRVRKAARFAHRWLDGLVGFLNGVLVGAALALLLLYSAVYFLVGAFIFALLSILWHGRTMYAAGNLIGAAVTVLVALILLWTR